MVKILVVEDEKPINDLITMNLKLSGYGYEKAYDGKQALELIQTQLFDLILLDVMLPEIDGFALMKKIAVYEIPVIYITAKNSLTDKLRGFDLGAEDYIVKPFETLDLLARIKVALRHGKKKDTVITLHGVKIDFEKREVYREKELIELTYLEFTLLEELIQNKNIALSREKLLEKVWGYDYAGGTRTVDVHIQRLRKKLEWEKHIITVYKMGYRLEVSYEV